MYNLFLRVKQQIEVSLMKRSWLAGLAFASLCMAHAVILPAPRELSETSGRFPLRSAQICFAATPSTEDLFAAHELASAFAEKAGVTLPVVESGCAGASIRFHRIASDQPLAGPGESPGPESREAYSIAVTPSTVRIESRSSAGLFYAVQTLRQMVEPGAGPALPEATVRDWPAVAYRGVMMDVSHTQLPRLDELKRQIDFLAHWKLNQYYFYSEASIALDGYPVLPPGAQFSKAQVREVIDYARQRHIDVIPNQELYGHLHDLFRMERYANLAPIPYGGELRPEDPRVARILADWIGQLSELFPSRFFHVGFDETWLLEREAARLGKHPEDLYLEQLQNVAALLEKHGKIPMAWADMMEKYPQIIPRLPKSLIAMPWHYRPISDEQYQHFLMPFKQAGVPMMVLGTVLNYHYLVPNYSRSFQVDGLLLAAGVKYGATGFVNSEWTDNTQAALMRTARPALAHSSITAWQGTAPPQADFFRQYAAAVYPDGAAQKIADALEQLDRAVTRLDSAQGGSLEVFWANPFSPERLRQSRQHIEDLHQSRLAAEKAEELLENVPEPVDAPTVHAWLVGSRLLNFAALRYIYADQIVGFWKELGDHPNKREVTKLIGLETAGNYHSRAADMMDAIGALRDEYRTAWLEEYTPFRLTVGLEKYDVEFQFWWRFQQRVAAVAAGFSDGDTLPPLETLVDAAR
jgi:hexosaminidase